MTSWVPTEEVAYRQLEKERIDSGLSLEEAQESITEQDIQARVERLEDWGPDGSGPLWRRRRWTNPMNSNMFDAVAYRSILEERMNSGLTELEAMESITDEQVGERITELENEPVERRAREQKLRTLRREENRDRARTAGRHAFWAFMALIALFVVSVLLYMWWPYSHVIRVWTGIVTKCYGFVVAFFVIRWLWSWFRGVL